MTRWWYCEETEHWYQDIDGIRLVYEHGVSLLPCLIGWYKPDGWGKPAPVENGYAAMVKEMLE